MTDPTNPAPPVEELRELLAKGTRRPWKVYRCFGTAKYAPHEVCTDGNYASGGVCAPHKGDDAALIVAAVNTLPALLDHLSVLSDDNVRLREENQRLTKNIMSGLLPGLLDAEETDALVDFVKSLRDGAALADLPDHGEG